MATEEKRNNHWVWSAFRSLHRDGQIFEPDVESSDLGLVVRALFIEREVIHGFVVLGPCFCQCCP